jgi:hypothetical protein
MDSFENDFFDGVKLEHLEFDIFSDEWQKLQAEIARNGWSIEEGLRYILAAGLRVIQSQQTWDDIESNKTDLQSELKRMQAERMQLDGRYAVMKFRAYQFMQAVKILEMKLNAAKTQMEGLLQLNHELRKRAR